MKNLQRKHKPAFPLHEWEIIEEKFSVTDNLLHETVFSQGNGYIGLRGTFEEGYDGPAGTSIEGTYLNGFYETVPIPYLEKKRGYAEYTQTMLNVTNGKLIALYLGEERFSLFSGKVLSYRRTLDMRGGTLTREVVWQSPQGKKVHLAVNRLVSFAERHLLAIRYRVTPLNFSGEITLCSALEGGVHNRCYGGEDPRLSSLLTGPALVLNEIQQSGAFAALLQQTVRSGFSLACAMDHRLQAESDYRLLPGRREQAALVKFIVYTAQEKPVILEKYVTYYTSRDYPAPELPARAEATLQKAGERGYDALAAEQAAFLARFWQKADVRIEGDPAAQQGLRFNLFHLLQSAGLDGKTNIAAKGLTGCGYDGHYFWDTEIYMFPFFLYTMPEAARQLLLYRYRILDAARRRARELSHPRGALYPWRTIAGEESSSYYPAGTAQYHINAAIAYTIKQYLEATGDTDFLLDYGTEMLFETARLWVSLGSFIPRKGHRFCINGVTGPDEYTALVNNNCYTNYMAQMHLQYAHDTAMEMQRQHRAAYRRVAGRISLRPDEPQAWLQAARRMYLPYDEALQIHPQDDSFLDKERWDFKKVNPERYPLLLHYHPLVIYRHQVCKQADVLLAEYLLGDRFTLEQKRRDFDYYEPLTTHDSSLSHCIHGILAAEIGYYDQARRFFYLAVRMDLDNLMGNTQYGIHAGNAGGSWLCLAGGFAGMRTYGGRLSFNPVLPAGWRAYCFKICFQGCLLEIDVDTTGVTYRLLSGAGLVLEHAGREVRLAAGESKTLPCRTEPKKITERGGKYGQFEAGQDP